MGGWWVGGWLLDFTRLMLISTQVEVVVEVGVEVGVELVNNFIFSELFCTMSDPST